jgi:CubicO group peptidase (beta-lactamase class C family)
MIQIMSAWKTIRRLTPALLCAGVLLGLASCAGFRPAIRWRASSPESQGMDPTVLAGIDGLVEDKMPDTSSVVVVRGGRIVFERYYQGNEDELRPQWSVTKTIVSMLVGIALQEGEIKSIDERMSGCLPEAVVRGIDPEMREITIRQLLTMTAGFRGDGGVGIDTLGGLRELLSRPPNRPPGTSFAYNGSDANLLSLILQESTGKTAFEYARERLFGPFGIRQAQWWEPHGFSLGAYGLELTTREMAELGYLYLREGRWGNKQIVSRKWVEESTTKLVEVPRQEKRYGFLWWAYSLAGYPLYTAEGYDGQYISVIPALDLVVAITGVGGGGSADRTPIIRDFVIRSIRAAGP